MNPDDFSEEGNLEGKFSPIKTNLKLLLRMTQLLPNLNEPLLNAASVDRNKLNQMSWMSNNDNLVDEIQPA